MSEIRLGRQTPTVSVVLPYKESKGSEAIEIYNKSGRTAQQWQELLIEDIMAVDESGLWVHMKFAYSVPRRNGKTEILHIRCTWGLTHGEKILYAKSVVVFPYCLPLLIEKYFPSSTNCFI